MTITFADNAPPDILIEREVDKAIEAGCPLPRWGWPVPGPYNGATGAERIRGWQKLHIANRLGLLPWPTVCTICLRDQNIGLHAECYFRPIASKGVCRSCHFHIHKRFKRPDEWRKRIRQTPQVETWARRLSLVELSRERAKWIAQQPDLWAALADP